MTPTLSNIAAPSAPRHALVTGGGQGIGAAIAHLLVRRGMRVTVLGRRLATGQVLAAEPPDLLHAVAADVANASEVAAAFADAVVRFGRVDVLVNNAGVLEQGAFASMPTASHAQMIQLNVAGLTALLAELLPPMVARGSGRVLNVASIAAFQPIPSLATYAATKAYVLSLTESLSEELRGTGVTLTALCPGITATGMLSKAREANAQLNQLPDFLIGDVDDVARQGFRACMRGDTICVPGVVNQAAMLASRSTPKWLVRRLGGLMARQAL